MTPEQIRERLADRTLTVVARGAGVSVHALYRFMRGATASHDTIVKLTKYLGGKRG